jgi:phosphatidylinositol dimannoside acyltransferase
LTAGAVSGAVVATPRRRRSLRSRLAVLLLAPAAWLLRRLPDKWLHRVAGRLGGVAHLVQRRRRRLVEANLRRVCAWLASQGLATPAVIGATTDERALGRLVRAAFGHYARSYLESLIVERYAGPALAERLTADDPALIERVFGDRAGRGRPLLLVGLHFGAIEIPALWATAHGVALTSPMETLDDPDLQAFLLRRRGASGLTLIPTAGAHRELSARLAQGEGVAIVADRLVGGSGARVEFFGAPARLPIGPAVLALESGAPAWAVATRRTSPGEYRTRLEPIELPAGGTRRERLAGFLANQARAYERLIADAPEQWWTLFFPIWEHGRKLRR